LAEQILERHDRLDILINNAAAVSGAQRQTSADGYELAFAVNYLAHFVLTYRLLPLLEASAPARIVNVSSMGQTPIDFTDVMMEHSYNPGDAYRRSKLAQIMFTIDLAAELDATHVTVNSLHPARSMNTARVINGGFQPLSTVEEGAEATMQLAVAAAYFVSRVGVHERGRQRWLYMLVATVVGVGLSALAVLVGDDTLRAVLLWSGTIYVAGLALAYGRSAFYAGYFLVFWVLFAMLTASRSPGEEIDYAASFLLGGIIAIVFIAIRMRFGWIEETDIEPSSTPTPTLKQAAQSDIGVFAMLWAFTMAIAIAIGYTFFSVEPFWVASTLLVVMQPDVAKGVKTGIQRGIGSATGGMLALALIAIFPGFGTSDLFVLYFFATTALCVVFYKANYMIYAFFMTQAVVAYYGFAVDDFTEAGGQRVLGVLLGVVIGLTGLGLQHVILESRHQRARERALP
jgi:hypothetical protein